MKSKVLSVIIAAVASLTAAAEVDLSMYKPVDPTKNLVKNGGFETELWIADKEFSEISSTHARECIEKKENLEKLLPQKVISFLNSH
jgi:nicotinic acid mononucleotide adenylyltransferase